MHVMYLVTYVVFGIVLAVLALALYQRLKTAAPVVMQVATAVGLMWAFVLVASGLVFNAGMAVVVDLYPANPDQAASVWQAIEPVAQGLGGSGGETPGRALGPARQLRRPPRERTPEAARLAGPGGRRSWASSR